MKKKVINTIITFIIVIHSNILLGQINQKSKIYSQKDFEKNKVFQDTYHLWWYKNKWFPSANDTLPYFVDDRKYKGIINYGVKFHSKDYRVFDFTEDINMYFLNVAFEKCTFSPRDSIIEIEGYITGGWSDKSSKGWNGTKNNIDVFIGEKRDTINLLYYKNIVNAEKVESRLNNKVIEDFVVLDSFPSFYFKNQSHYRTQPDGKRFFKIKGKVNKNTILAFGSRTCYSEIFEIGSMVFLPKKNNAKKKIETADLLFKPIIIKNKLVSDIEKQKEAEKNINYYTYTEKAENYILRNQYAKAKETYILLAKEYKTIYARDIHNAIRCAILSRDHKSAFTLSEKLAAKGVGLSYFNAQIFSSLKKNTNWENFTIRYDSIYKINQNKLHSNLNQKLKILVDEDQNDYGLATRKDPKVLFETTERVTGKLINLLEQEGFPSEEKIGIFVKNDTSLVFSPRYYVLIQHAIRQKPSNLKTLNQLLDKSIEAYEYDSKRSVNNVMDSNPCFHIYKGSLYNSKSCKNNDLMLKKMLFMFNNPHSFIIHNGDFIVVSADKENPEETDKYYEEHFNFIIKLTDNWEFYED